MASTHDDTRNRIWRGIVWTLRISVAWQCLGNWRWMTQVEETPLLHWMLDPADVGGLAWSESTALVVQQIVGWCVLAAGALALWRPSAVVLLLLALLQLLITIAMWRIAEGYPLRADWLPSQLLTLFPFATEVARMFAPLALWFVDGVDPNDVEGERRIDRAMQAMRLVVAIVFLAHGIEALQLNPKFVDLLLNSMQNVFGWSMSESTAVACLTTIGVVDIAIAIACVFVRSRAILGWMAFWGLVTAVSRILANGWGMSWHETFTRAPHFGIPLAIVLWWHLLKWKATETTEAQHAPSLGKPQSDSANH